MYQQINYMLILANHHERNQKTQNDLQSWKLEIIHLRPAVLEQNLKVKLTFQQLPNVLRIFLL